MCVWKYHDENLFVELIYSNKNIKKRMTEEKMKGLSSGSKG
jgi:hypothetical protein